VFLLAALELFESAGFSNVFGYRAKRDGGYDVTRSTALDKMAAITAPSSPAEIRLFLAGTKTSDYRDICGKYIKNKTNKKMLQKTSVCCAEGSWQREAS